MSDLGLAVREVYLVRPLRNALGDYSRSSSHLSPLGPSPLGPSPPDQVQMAVYGVAHPLCIYRHPFQTRTSGCARCLTYLNPLYRIRVTPKYTKYNSWNVLR